MKFIFQITFEPLAVWGGHLLSAYEQNTQQSPFFGFNILLQFVHL